MFDKKIARRFPIADLAIGLVMGAVAATLCIWCSRQFPAAIYDRLALDIWFDGDAPVLFENFTDPHSPYLLRTRVHPLFPLVTTMPVSWLRGLGVSNPLTAVRIVLCLAAAVWGSSFYALLRAVGNRRLDSVVFAMLGLSSAAVLFWIGLPEHHFMGSISLMLALLLIGAGRHGASGLRYTLASCLSLSITVTNWMLGIAAAVIGHSPKRALQITASALGIVGLLGIGVKLIYPTSSFFISAQRQEAAYLQRPTAAHLMAASQAFFLPGMTLPAMRIVPNGWMSTSADRLSVQEPPGKDRTAPQGVAAAVWISLLLLGLVGVNSATAEPTLKATLILTIFGGYLLHLVYGAEAFLYSPNYLPLLVAVASMGTQTRYRRAVLALAGLLLLLNSAINGAQFHRAISLFDSQYRLFKASSK